MLETSPSSILELFPPLDVFQQCLIDGFFFGLHPAQTHRLAEEMLVQFYVGCHVRGFEQNEKMSILDEATRLEATATTGGSKPDGG